MSRFQSSMTACVFAVVLGLVCDVSWAVDKKPKNPPPRRPPPAEVVPPKSNTPPPVIKKGSEVPSTVKKKSNEAPVVPKKSPQGVPQINPKLIPQTAPQINPKFTQPGVVLPGNSPKTLNSNPRGQNSVSKPKITLKSNVGKSNIGTPMVGGKGTIGPSQRAPGVLQLNPQPEPPGTPRTGDAKTLKLANGPVKMKPMLVPKNGLIVGDRIGQSFPYRNPIQKPDDSGKVLQLVEDADKGKVLQLKPDPGDVLQLKPSSDSAEEAARKADVLRGLFGASKRPKKSHDAEIMPLGLTEEQQAKWNQDRGIPDAPSATLLQFGNDSDPAKGATILPLETDTPPGQQAMLMQFPEREHLFRTLQAVKASPQLQRDLKLQDLNLDKISGVHQFHLARSESFQSWKTSNLGLKLGLAKQFEFQRQGDLSRRLNLSQNLLSVGGWTNRHHMGLFAPSFTTSAFSSWYAGGGYYPAHAWCPTWSPWVDWCWWDTCPIIYDPRPYYCIPIVYDPCGPWVHYHYPVWRPLPIVVCGTWIDVPPVVISTGLDVRLLAVRFVDNGHLEQHKGPRYRIWAVNHSPVPIEVPFSITLLASNDLTPTVDLPQAGVTVPWMAAGETLVIDIRLPLTANQLGLTPKGQRVPFNYLHILVDSLQQVPEVSEDNNGAVVARQDILPVDPAAFSTDQTAAIPDSLLSIAGEGFGPEPGQVIVSIDGQQVQAEIFGWYDLGVQFGVPNFELVEPMEAEVLVVRGDGAVSNPLTIQLAPHELYEAAAVPVELPLP